MRHLIIGNNVAKNYTSNILDDKAVDIQKLGVDGPQSLGAGEGVADSEQIRFVQGTGKKAIVSPWIYGRNIISASGKTNSAPTPNKVSIDCATDAAADGAGTLDIKFVRKDGPAPEFFNFQVSIANSRAVADQAADIHNAFEALDGIPDWLNPLAVVAATDQCHFQGAIRGDEAQSGNTWEYGPVTFDIVVTSTVGSTVYTVAEEVAADPGIGDGNLILQLEKDLQGGTYGYYDRRNLPIAPATTAVAATDYDVYNIVATKDGSTTSAINGVDNLIEVMVVLDSAGTGQPGFEAQLNGYIGSVGFAPINL